VGQTNFTPALILWNRQLRDHTDFIEAADWSHHFGIGSTAGPPAPLPATATTSI